MTCPFCKAGVPFSNKREVPALIDNKPAIIFANNFNKIKQKIESYQMFKELLDKQKELKAKQEDLENLVKKFCQDKKKPLDQRWELFQACGFGEEKPWIWHWDKRGGIMDDCLTQSDRFGRGQTIDVVEEIELIQESTIEPTQEYIDAIKELVLKTWIKSYKFDW